MKVFCLLLSVLFLLTVNYEHVNAQLYDTLPKGNKKTVKSSAAKNVAKVYFIMKQTTAGRDSIVHPPEGMTIFNATVGYAQRYTGKAWKKINANERYIGEEFAGGIVLYIDSTKAHGLIVAPADQSASAQWGFFKNQVGAHGKNIGDGKVNTDIIAKSSTEKGIAANLCSTLQLNGYSDWILPSIEELKLMYYNFKAKALGNFSSSQYWSSSETDFNNTWIMNFGIGVATENNVVSNYAVRAVRYF